MKIVLADQSLRNLLQVQANAYVELDTSVEVDLKGHDSPLACPPCWSAVQSKTMPLGVSAGEVA